MYSKIKKKRSSIKKLVDITISNEGSHTRLIQYKTSSYARISVLQKNNKKVRYVWLGASLYKNITFARSLWKLNESHTNDKKYLIDKPIGLSFITNKNDIHKNIYETYYCHCNKFERKLKLKSHIWGRKYIICERKKQRIIVQEFFSAQIIL